MTIGDGIAVAGTAWAAVGLFWTASRHRLRLSELVLEARKNGIDAEIGS
jgi:hypothetical protein